MYIESILRMSVFFCFSITPTDDQSILMSLLIVDGFNMVLAIAYQCCFDRCGPECRCKCP